MTDTCEWRRQWCEHIDRFRNLEENWDSYGAAPPTDAAIEKAKGLVSCISIGPTRDGGMSVAIDFDKVSFFLEIDSEGKVTL